MAKKLGLDEAYAMIGSIDTGGASVYEPVGFVYLTDEAREALATSTKAGRFGETTKLVSSKGAKTINVQEDMSMKEPIGLLVQMVAVGKVIEIDGKKIAMATGRAKIIFGNCPAGTPEMSKALTTKVESYQKKSKEIKDAHKDEKGYVGGPLDNPEWIALAE